MDPKRVRSQRAHRERLLRPYSRPRRDRASWMRTVAYCPAIAARCNTSIPAARTQIGPPSGPSSKLSRPTRRSFEYVPPWDLGAAWTRSRRRIADAANPTPCAQLEIPSAGSHECRHCAVCEIALFPGLRSDQIALIQFVEKRGRIASPRPYPTVRESLRLFRSYRPAAARVMDQRPKRWGLPTG